MFTVPPLALFLKVRITGSESQKHTTKHSHSSRLSQTTKSTSLSRQGRASTIPEPSPNDSCAQPGQQRFIWLVKGSLKPFLLFACSSFACSSPCCRHNLQSLSSHCQDDSFYLSLLNVLLLWSSNVQPPIPRDVKRHRDELPFFIFYIHMYLNVNKQTKQKPPNL